MFKDEDSTPAVWHPRPRFEHRIKTLGLPDEKVEEVMAWYDEAVEEERSQEADAHCQD